MAKQQFNRRLSDEAITAINWWAKQDSTPARKVTDTEIVEQAIALYDAHRANGGGGCYQVQANVFSVPAGLSAPLVATDPASIPGVSVGLPPDPVRESGLERAQREKRERQERATALDSSGGDRDDIDRGDDYVSQG